MSKYRLPNGSREWRSQNFASLQFPADGAFVYVAWGDDVEQPLYVGKTKGLLQRLGQHERSSRWFPMLRWLEVYGYPTEKDALWAEAHAIDELRPHYNKAGMKGAVALLEYMEARKLRRLRHGPPLTFDEISADQLEIVRRVQNRDAA